MRSEPIRFKIEKDGHIYAFSFSLDDHDAAVSCLLDYAIDERFNISPREVFYAVRALRELDTEKTSTQRI